MASSTTRRRVGATVELDGAKEYKDAIAELNVGNATLRSEMQKLQAEYKGQADSTEFLTKKGVLLEQQLLQQQDKVKKLQEAVAWAAKKYKEADSRTQEWIQKLNRAQAEEFNLKHAIEENNQALENQGNVMNKVAGSVQGIADKFGIQLPAGADKALNAMKGFSNGSVAAMAAVGAAVAAVVEGVKALTQMTLDVAADVDTIITESIVTGIDTKTYQALQYAENLVDVSVSSMSSSLTKLMQNMNAARNGNEDLAKTFQSLGIEIQNSDGTLRDSYDVMMEIVDALGMMESGTERDIVTTQLLGKSAQELNPLINAGSKALKEYADQAEAMGYILDEQQIEKLGEVDDAYQEVQLTVEALKKQMAADFAPAAKEAMELFADVVQKAGEYLKQSGIIENLASIITSLIEIIRTTGQYISSLPTIKIALKELNVALTVVAYTFAAISDFIKIIVGLLPTMWGSGMLKEGLGLGYASGNANSVQRLTMARQGRLEQYDEFYAGRNAGGTDSWRGGLTWVGEAGPELVALPQGSSVYSAQDSQNMGGDTYIFDVNVKDLEDLQGLIWWAKNYRVTARMR